MSPSFPTHLSSDVHAYDHADLGLSGLAYRGDHLGAVADDALALHLRADHEPGHVGQEHEWDVEGVAPPDEPGGLVGRVAEEGAAQRHRVVGHDAHRAALDRKSTRLNSSH